MIPFPLLNVSLTTSVVVSIFFSSSLTRFGSQLSLATNRANQRSHHKVGSLELSSPSRQTPGVFPAFCCPQSSPHVCCVPRVLGVMLASRPSDPTPMTNGAGTGPTNSVASSPINAGVVKESPVWNLRSSLDTTRIETLGVAAASVRCWLTELRCHTEPECSHVLQSKSILPSSQTAQGSAGRGANRISPSGKDQ